MKPVITFLIMSLASFLFVFNPMTASNVASMCSVHPKHLSKRWEWCLLLGMGWRIPLQVHFSIAFLKTTPWNKTSFRRVLPSCSVSVSSRHNTPGSLLKTESWKSSEGWRFHRVSSPTHLSLLLGTHLVLSDSACEDHLRETKSYWSSGQMYVLCMLPLKNGWVDWTMENTEEPEKVGMMNQSCGKFPTGPQ